MPARTPFRIRAASGVVVATIAIAGCGGGGGHPRTTPAVHTTVEPIPDARTLPQLTATGPARLHRATHRRPRPHPASAGPPIGTTQHTTSRGSALTVTIERLIDPLTGSGASLLPGTRAVAVLVSLSNAGPSLYDSSATGDFSISVSHGAVTPLFVPAGTCQTPVEDFDRYMTPGEERSGCVAFAIDRGARVRGVSFSPHAAAAGRLRWSAGAG